MDSREGKKHDLGAVMVAVLCVITRQIVLVKDLRRPNAVWKLPGGGIDEQDVANDRTQTIETAGAREVAEEAGVRVPRVQFIQPAVIKFEGGRPTYYPNFALAEITADLLPKLGTRGDENGKPTQVAVFDLAEVPEMVDFLDRHRAFVKQIADLVCEPA